MEKEIEKTCKHVIKRTSMLEENKDYYLVIEDAKEIVREVLSELQPRYCAVILLEFLIVFHNRFLSNPVQIFI